MVDNTTYPPAPAPTAAEPPSAKTDEELLAMAKEIEARYVPPPLPPSVLEQLGKVPPAGAPAEPPPEEPQP
jgi:hypothetical protein